MTKEQLIKIAKYTASEAWWQIDRRLSYLSLGPGTGLYCSELMEEKEPEFTKRRTELDQQRKEIIKQFRR